MNRMLVAGPRHPNPEWNVEKTVRSWMRDIVASWSDATDPTTILHGGAIGVDTWAGDEAEKCGLKVEVIKPDYKLFDPKVAPLVRNALLVSKAENVHVFWHGAAVGGTCNTLWLAHKLNKQQGFTLIDPTVTGDEAVERFAAICRKPHEHWLQAYELYRGYYVGGSCE